MTRPDGSDHLRTWWNAASSALVLLVGTLDILHLVGDINIPVCYPFIFPVGHPRFYINFWALCVARPNVPYRKI